MPHSTPSAIPAKRLFHLSPPQTITLGFAAMILTGALLLCLPIASKSGQATPFVDALFTAGSANCVTGLVVVNTLEHWSIFGQVVIMLLIQLGGLGLTVLLTGSMVLLHRRISLEHRMMVQAAFNQDNFGGMVRLVRLVLRVTLVIEGAGALLLAGFFLTESGTGLGTALYKGVFHAVSAFCNAGFDIVGPSNLEPYVSSPFVNFVIMALIVSGGLGFTVWGELLFHPRGPKKPHKSLRLRFAHLSLHTKLVLLVTAGMLVVSTLCFSALEWNNPETLGPLSPPVKVMAALFQSVTLRTAGFNTIPQGGLTDPSLFSSCLVMFVGGSPAGTAGGIKTVTLGIVLFSIISAMRGRECPEAFGRRFPLDLLQKALTVMGLLLFVILGATMALYFTELSNPQPHSFLDLMFECFSAGCTVGNSTGLTPHLSSAGKLLVTLCMYLGRVGPLSVVLSVNMRNAGGNGGISYTEERVVIG